MSTRRSELRTGWGRVLVFVYGIFAVAATGFLLWRYRGGPWEAAGRFDFRSAA